MSSQYQQRTTIWSTTRPQNPKNPVVPVGHLLLWTCPPVCFVGYTTQQQKRPRTANTGTIPNNTTRTTNKGVHPWQLSVITRACGRFIQIWRISGLTPRRLFQRSTTEEKPRQPTYNLEIGCAVAVAPRAPICTSVRSRKTSHAANASLGILPPNNH